MLILVANEKGGVGKTTLASNLAAMSARAGKSTLLVDTDKQESATSWAAVRHENEVEPSITCVTKTGKVGYDLANLRPRFDVIVVDAGGRDSIEMRQAMAVADRTVIPILPAQFDVWSLARMAQLVREVAERTEMPVDAVAVINGASTNPSIKEEAEARAALRDYAGFFPTLEVAIAERIAFRKAAREGLGVVELRKDSTDAKAVSELCALYKEVFGEDWNAAATK